MPLILEVPSQYGYVLAVATSTFFLNSYYSIVDTMHRKASGLKYPIAYASVEQADKDPAAFLFNCAQRAHANYTENLTSFLGALFIAGLRFPVASSAVGAFWVLSRLYYVIGYTSSAGPKGRSIGSAGGFLGDIAMKGMAAYTAFSFIMAA